MPDDTITLVSTTDTAEQVQEALTNKPAEKPVEKPADKPAAEKADEPAPTETSEQAAERDRREASEAGGKLAERRAKIQREIDAETRRKHDLRRDVEAEEARLNELRRQRQEFEGGTPAAKAPAATPATAAAETPAAPKGRPEPTLNAVDAEGNAKYATYEDYLSDHAAWGREEAVLATRAAIEQEKAAERARIERDSETRVVNERIADYNAKLETFKQTHADFDAVLEAAKEEIQESLVALGGNALKVIDGYTVFDAEDGPALSYYLLKHTDELKAIALKAPPQQLVHLARLEAQLRSQGGASKKPGPSPAASQTKAPEPIRPVGSGPTATVTAGGEDESYQDYRARRERELRARRGY